MTPGELRDSLYDAGVRLWSDGGRLRYQAPAGTMTPSRIAAMKEHKPVLLAILQLEMTRERMNERIFELADASVANRLYGAVDAALAQEQEIALLLVPYSEAGRQLLALMEGADEVQPALQLQEVA